MISQRPVTRSHQLLITPGNTWKHCQNDSSGNIWGFFWKRKKKKRKGQIESWLKLEKENDRRKRWRLVLGTEDHDLQRSLRRSCSRLDDCSVFWSSGGSDRCSRSLIKPTGPQTWSHQEVPQCFLSELCSNTSCPAGVSRELSSFQCEHERWSETSRQSSFFLRLVLISMTFIYSSTDLIL